MNDINLTNIFYKKTGEKYEFVYGDTGLSTDNMSSSCQTEDWMRLDYKLIVECDENGHADRKPCNKRERMDYVNDIIFFIKFF
jgi:hypothetical protein